MAIGSTKAMAASPSNCINRSAAMAPGAPSMLRTAADVAWLKLGSRTDQVASAAAAARRHADQSKAAAFAQAAAKHPAQIFGEIGEAVEAAIDRGHVCSQPSTATRRWSASAAVSLSCTMATRM